MPDPDTVMLAADLTVAWLSNPSTRADADDVDAFLKVMARTVSGLSAPAGPAGDAEPSSEHVPAVSARKSLASREHIVSMIDGRPYRTLKRHLATHGLTPDTYRERYGLKPDYPMVAPGYSDARRETAKRLGLGRKPATAAVPPEAPAEPARKPRGRKSAADAKAAAQAHLGGAKA